MKAWLASIPVTTLLLYIFASVLSLLLLAYLAYLAWGAWKRLDELELKDRFAARNDFIKTTAQILGGAFFLITIYFTYQNLSVSQKNLVATQEKNVTDLYTKAIEQLGDKEQLAVRLGAIYALERIARDSKKDHWPIMEVLTAYVRENAPASDKTPPKPSSRLLPGFLFPIKIGEYPKTDIQAVLTVLGRTAIPFAQKGEKPSLDLRGTELADADLTGACFQGAKLLLYKANLQRAFFLQANLQGTYFEGGNLEGANFLRANLHGAKFLHINLKYAKFFGADLQEVDFGGFEIMGIRRFFSPSLQGADFRHAKLQGADLKRVRDLTTDQVEEAYWDETTKWPFTPPAPRREEKQEGK